MDIFILFSYSCCDDHHYGYQERFHSAYDTLEKAKEHAMQMINRQKNNKYYQYDGENGNPFLTVVKVPLGSIEREEVFTSMEVTNEESTQA